jgi:signal transduction histidine kinase
VRVLVVEDERRLALVQTIVRGHGGQLLICSNTVHHAVADGGLAAPACTHPEAGATVTVVLPGEDCS